MEYKPILGATLGLQSTALMASNLSLLKKKQKKNAFLKQGVKNIVGVNLIGATASMI